MQKFFRLLIMLALPFTTKAQNADSIWFVNNYIKKEQMIPMRDGIKLFTSMYIPKDKSEKHPILLTRTPYSCAPYGENNFSGYWSSFRNAYLKENYIIVTEDVRGRYMSEGIFEDVRPYIKDKKNSKDIDEASDTYDAIEWMIKNIDGNNGNVGVVGTSYPGFYSTEAAISGHPALKAVSPQAPVTDWFIGDDFHHKGAFFPMDGFSFYSSFGKPRPIPTPVHNEGFKTTIHDNYKFYLQAGALPNLARLIGDSIKFWHEMYKHPNYDAWWQARNARVGLYKVKPAMLWVGGLFDAEDCWGAWNSYKACEIQSPQTKSSIVMGPWYHGQWSAEGSYLGNIKFGANTSAFYQDEIEIPFFNYYLKNKGSIEKIPEASVFITGRNVWQKFSQWPPVAVQNKSLYVKANNSLSFSPGSGGTGNYDYTSDPAHPVPYTEDVHDGRTREYMTDDQRFAGRRPDVITLQMDELTEDLSLTGPVIADIVTSISTTDADFVVKLIDVFPDNFNYGDSFSSPAGRLGGAPMGGYQMLVRGEIMRGKFRNSFEKPEAFIPNKTTHVRFELPDVAHTFKKGHMLMIQIQSSWFPLADRNPQKFMNIYEAKDADFKKSTIRIYYGGAEATQFILPVIKL